MALHLADLGVRPVRVDLAKLPEHGFAVRTGGGRPARVLLGTSDGMVDPATCVAAWWRRPRAVAPPQREPSPPSTARAFGAAAGVPQDDDARTRRLSDAEWTAALAGMVRVVRGTWVNDPGCEELARRKLAQLEAAREVGLPVPRTLVTNDPALARRFVAACRRGAIAKSLSSTADGGYTRAVRSRDEWLRDRLRVGPAILQERVEGIDVRVTVVGDAIFAMSVDARHGSSPDDVRSCWDEIVASARPERLPEDLVRRVLALHRRLGLRFGAVDLRRRRGGEYAFLEVNPSGQWMHAEDATGHPIGATLARLLACGAAGASSRTSPAPGASPRRVPPRHTGRATASVTNATGTARPPQNAPSPPRTSPAPGSAPVQARVGLR
ncbi:MAG TPA: alpha-L-glutamate ligase [Anaeromyxobacteraceae bacterium]|nr:alpha-L-glutamate ligase [Anaeromyxobacteraceae bacterium]